MDKNIDSLISQIPNFKPDFTVKAMKTQLLQNISSIEHPLSIFVSQKLRFYFRPHLNSNERLFLLKEYTEKINELAIPFFDSKFQAFQKRKSGGSSLQSYN